MGNPDNLTLFMAEKNNIPKEVIDFFWSVFDLYNIREKIGQYKGIVFEVRSKERNHNRPHIHASYDKYSVSIALDTFEVLAGNIPKKQERIACEWVKNNIELCQSRWDNYHLEKTLALTNSKFSLDKSE